MLYGVSNMYMVGSLPKVYRPEEIEEKVKEFRERRYMRGLESFVQIPLNSIFSMDLHSPLQSLSMSVPLGIKF